MINLHVTSALNTTIFSHLLPYCSVPYVILAVSISVLLSSHDQIPKSFQPTSPISFGAV